MIPPKQDKAILKPPSQPTSKVVKRRKFELNSKNLRLVMMGTLTLLVIIFFVITSSGLSLISAKSKSLVDLKAKSQSTDNELLNLEQSKRDVEKYAYFKDVAKTVIPSDKNQAESVLEIFQMASASGLSLQSITFPVSNLGLRATTTTTTTPQDATSASSTASVLTQAKPVADIPGLYSLELTISPESGPLVPAALQITYPKMLDFLSRIENNRHTAQITQVIVQPPTKTQSLSFTLTVNIFIKP